MSNYYSATVSVDNNTANVVFVLETDSNKATAQIGPRSARRIAIQLLQAATEMDDLREAMGEAR